ncbi:MAG: hypothetical protein Q9206_001298 [Seirophora lacunosa]
MERACHDVPRTYDAPITIQNFEIELLNLEKSLERRVEDAEGQVLRPSSTPRFLGGFHEDVGTPMPVCNVRIPCWWEPPVTFCLHYPFNGVLSLPNGCSDDGGVDWDLTNVRVDDCPGSEHVSNDGITR